MLVVDVYNHRFHKVYSSNDPVNNILDRDDIFMLVHYMCCFIVMMGLTDEPVQVICHY
jgi:hypothetical protein